MLFLIAALAVGLFFYSRAPRLEGATHEATQKAVRAYVDGKPVKSYLRE